MVKRLKGNDPGPKLPRFSLQVMWFYDKYPAVLIPGGVFFCECCSAGEWQPWKCRTGRCR